MKPTNPFIPIYDLSDSPPDDEPELTGTFVSITDTTLHPDPLDIMNADYDGQLIVMGDMIYNSKAWAELLSEIAAAPITKLGD